MSLHLHVARIASPSLVNTRQLRVTVQGRLPQNITQESEKGNRIVESDTDEHLAMIIIMVIISAINARASSA